MPPANQTLSRRAKISRRLASWIITHPFPGASVVVRNMYRLWGTPPPGQFRVATNAGYDIVIDPHRNRGLDRLLYFNGIYEAGTLQVMTRYLPRGGTFLDIGANIGLMSIAAAHIVGDAGVVHCFEPIEDLADVVAINLDGCPGTFHLHRCALGSHAGTMTIFEQPEINRGSATLIRPSGSHIGRAVSVKCLDDFFESAQLSGVDFAKIDVEGFELEVLKGARRMLSLERAPVLCIEVSTTHASSGSGRDIYDLVVGEYGYAAFKLEYGKDVTGPLAPVARDRLPAHDNVFFLPQWAQLDSAER